MLKIAGRKTRLQLARMPCVNAGVTSKKKKKKTEYLSFMKTN